jgi:hypothetical protein
MKKLIYTLFIFLAVIFLSDGSAEAAVPVKDESSHRFFAMGFSSWPYDLTLEAVNWGYEQVGKYGDFIDEHLEEGVPWPEAQGDLPFPRNYQDVLNFRKSKRLPGHKLLVSINPLSIGRNSLAPYRGEAPNQTLPKPWDQRSLNDPIVKQAYLKYARRLIEFFSPDYFCMGVEVNLLKKNRPDLWPAFLELHKYVYSELKKQFPELKILVSLEACSLLEGYTDADYAGQMQAVNDILPYTDIVGISLHPFMSKNLAENIPADMFRRIRSLSDKPMAITETSYPAEKFTIKIHGIPVDFNGTPEKQKEYLRQLLTAVRDGAYLFVTWFSIRDYDAIYNKLGGGDLLLIWRDTGLFDQTGRPRPGFDVWQQWLNQ